MWIGLCSFFLLLLSPLLFAQLPPNEQQFWCAFEQTTNINSTYPFWTCRNAARACVVGKSVIHCDNQNHITFLKLSEPVVGYIPSQIGLLSNLNYMDFDNCPIGGSIPEEIGLLSKLGVLIFSNTQITGSLPDSITKLTQLDTLLFPPNIRTTIPENIGALSGLSTLMLGSNFYGTLPESFGNLRNLRLLFIGDSELNGTLPNGISQFTKLELLSIFNNRFTGTIPDLSAMTTLRDLYLQEKQLTGKISVSSFTSLQDITVDSSSTIQLCGCFNQHVLRNCTLNNVITSCGCTLPSPCPTEPCSTNVCT